jgi:putative DNA primase/helicase
MKMPRLREALTDEMRAALMNAAEIANALKARSAGRHQWMARCPGHPDRNPSLSISVGQDGRTLVHCFAGCSQEDVIEALRARGLWANGEASHDRLITPSRREPDDASRIAYAFTVWNSAFDPRGTIAEDYLASRKLVLPPPELCSTVLRFHPACPWEGNYVPCLIAAFRDFTTDKLRAIHRIRVDQPDRWPKTERKMLGPVAGSAVKLDPVGTSLVVGEGVETCLAARQLGLSPVWALGSAGAIERFAPVPGVDELVILGENDNGSNGAAAAECCRKWKPRDVHLFAPPTGFKDLNDVLMENKKI